MWWHSSREMKLEQITFYYQDVSTCTANFSSFNSTYIIIILSSITMLLENPVIMVWLVSVLSSVTGPLIEDEDYWKKCCQDRWPLCVVAHHGGSWKRMLFERHVQELIENFVPKESDINKVISCKCFFLYQFVSLLSVEGLILLILIFIVGGRVEAC